MSAMNMTIHAIQALKLSFSVDAIHAQNARLMVQCTRILQQTLAAPTHATTDDLQAMLQEDFHGISRNSLCTWRPTYCLDIVVYIEQNKGVSVGIPMFDCDTHPTAEIKYFQSETYNKIDMEDCVCFAHLTCDTDAQQNNSMVVLVYDVAVKSCNMQDTAQRYSYLREIEHGLNQLVLGQACVRVQWAGHCAAFDKIQSITLPHAHDTIIVYGNDYTYRKFKMSPPAVEGDTDPL